MSTMLPLVSCNGLSAAITAKMLLPHDYIHRNTRYFADLNFKIEFLYRSLITAW
jgi:hypothetical protein